MSDGYADQEYDPNKIFIYYNKITHGCVQSGQERTTLTEAEGWHRVVGLNVMRSSNRKPPFLLIGRLMTEQEKSSGKVEELSGLRYIMISDNKMTVMAIHGDGTIGRSYQVIAIQLEGEQYEVYPDIFYSIEDDPKLKNALSAESTKPEKSEPTGFWKNALNMFSRGPSRTPKVPKNKIKEPTLAT